MEAEARGGGLCGFSALGAIVGSHSTVQTGSSLTWSMPIPDRPKPGLLSQPFPPDRNWSTAEAPAEPHGGPSRPLRSRLGSSPVSEGAAVERAAITDDQRLALRGRNLSPLGYRPSRTLPAGRVCLWLTAASIKAENNGWGRFGRLKNSGWNWLPSING